MVRMKHTDDRTMVVIGAGASIGSRRYPIMSSMDESLSRMPSSRQFFYDLFSIGPSALSDGRFLNFLAPLYEGTYGLITNAWALSKSQKHFSPHEWRRVDVEEVFSFLDIGEKMFSRNTQYRKAFSIAREALEHFIVTMLEFRCQGQHCEYLSTVFGRLGPQDNIVSFNWDTIADYTLQQSADSAQFGNYIRLMTAARIAVRDYVHPGLYLKLHGSLNWVSCGKKSCHLFGKVRLPLATDGKMHAKLLSDDFARCPVCGDGNPVHCIVPPTSEKHIHANALVHKMWLIARAKLAFTHRIVFIGYSFPPTDAYSEWLFRQINFLDGGRPEVVVVNPEYARRNSVVRKRYRAIFRNCKITSFRTLAEFAKEAQYWRAHTSTVATSGDAAHS